MQTNEFEKQVREKMDELKIHPSESVWQNVEAAITRIKRRRRGWIFLPLLFMVLSVTGYWLFQQSPSSPNHPAHVTGPEKNTTTNVEKSPDDELSKKNVVAGTLVEPSTQKNTAKSQHTQPARVAVIQVPPKKILAETPHPVSVSPAVLVPPTQKDEATDVANNILQPLPAPVSSQNADQRNVPGTTLDNLEQSNKTEVNTLLHKPTEISAGTPATDTIVPHNGNDIAGTYPRPAGKSKAGKKTKNTPIIAYTKTWKWGMVFSAGVSGVPNSFLGSLDKNYTMADAFGLSLPPNNNTSSRPPVLPSKIESSGAFTAGLFGEKNISKNKLVAVGLSYKMFSTTNKIGIKSDTVRGYNLTNPVNTYHNYYHFIEVPLTLKVQLSIRKIPLFWEVGFAVSRLVGSNALQLSNIAAVYNEDNSVFNKTQVGFSTGFSTALFYKRKTAILIGPYIYYGTSKVATEGLYTNQHFTFLGIKSQILFKK